MRHNFLYETTEWQARKRFIRFIDDACAATGITITWLSGDWIARLEKDRRVAYIYGYTFPLNNAVAAGIIRDKAATYQVLSQQNLPAVPHHLLRREDLSDNTDLTTLALQLAKLPVVVKPNVGGSGGRHVYKCETKMELAKNLALVAEGEKAIAISPLLVLNREFRVLVLDGEVKILFEKRRQADIWHHNLRLGAKPVAVTDTTLAAQLHSLALNVMSTLQARIGAVDIVETPTGLAVMEVNGGIMLNHFGAHSADNQAVAKNVYQEIITKSMQ